MSSRLEKCSKSLPPVEFQLYVSSADSGIDSDTSPVASTKLSSSISDFEEVEDVMVSPQAFLVGSKASENERIEGIGKAINWIREELIKMKETDKQLTKTLIQMRSRIAEQKNIMESTTTTSPSDPGYYDTETINSNNSQSAKKKEAYKKENWRLIAKDGAFPTDGLDFQNNKRATWII